ncbi:MAG: nucleotidyl transferase AbiEii/AbiGii toxin family protein [Pseudomonadota bacterium]
MSSDRIYHQQAELLLDILPFIQKLDCFALKGGTAINLFVRDMPRLSIDIDLAYLPIEPRKIFLNNLNKSVTELAQRLKAEQFYVEKKCAKQSKQVNKLIVSNGKAEIKVEPNTVLRGSVFGIKEFDLSQAVQDTFLQSQKARLLSIADLYAGKICAALDRQHPRDLFDIKLMFENEGLSNEIRQAFVVYLASSARPMSELLRPNKLDMRDVYNKEFLGMTNLTVSYEELEDIRNKLIAMIQSDLTNNERQFLISIKEGNPGWDLLPIPDIEKLPALQWKLINIDKMNKNLKQKSLNKLKRVLNV